ncbi:hypothetical protein N7533_010430, partial [Penicillium manginii]|uniref:uncharacterized protein n=1 Tax=Penicillium manginii TaxID=203109 RepID=UPI002549062F
ELRRSIDASSQPPPPILKRVGPNRKKNWILYESENSMEFLIWWAKTEYGQVLNKSHYTKVWRRFDQVANILTGRPKVICRTYLTLLDHPQHKKHGTNAIGKHQKSKSCRQGQKRTYRQTLATNSIQKAFLGASSNCKKFTTLQLEERLLKTIAILRLPFQTIENPEFQALLNLVHSGPGELEIPSAKTLQRRLRDSIAAQQEIQLRDLPEDTKNYREILLGFEPLHGAHSRVNLNKVLLQVLKDRRLLDRIFSVTTDNTTNNETLIRALQESLLSSGAISTRESIVRIPYMAHVIQLCLKQLLGHIRATPKNKEVRRFWSDTQTVYLRDSLEHSDVAHTLAKQKLKDYYEKTYRDHRFLYGTAALLAPQYKLYTFNDTEYSQCISETSKRYCKYLRSSFAQYQQRNPEMLFRAIQRPSLQASELERLLKPIHTVETSEGVRYNEENLEENKANKETKDKNTAISNIDESNLVEDTDISPTVQSVLGFESTASQELPSHSQPQDVTMTAIRPDPESDDEDLLPPPVTHLGERYQKRSSGRITVPSSRLEGYELY